MVGPHAQRVGDGNFCVAVENAPAEVKVCFVSQTHDRTYTGGTPIRRTLHRRVHKAINGLGTFSMWLQRGQ